MFNFIICEDDQIFNKKYQNIIDTISIQFHIECKKYIFYNYNKDFFEIMKKDIPNKIYILDILVGDYKGTEIANKIRKNDLKSLIIFITSHYDKYSKDMLENKYMFLKYIDKKGNYAEELKETIHDIIFDMDKEHIITINKKDITYKIETKDILYLYSEERKTHIVTNLYQATSSKPLSYYKRKIPHNFVYSHKSCIINLNKISTIDKKARIITFQNNYKTNLLSKKYLKELLEKMEKNYQKSF